MLPDGGGGTGGNRYGDHRIRDSPLPGHLFQVPGEIYLGGGRQLASGVPQSSEVTAEVGAAD